MEPTHIDDYIDNRYILKDKQEELTPYARWMFNHFRLPAAMRWDFDPFMEEHKLFCEYKGVKYRVVGASRLGDVWLTLKFESTQYQERVAVDDCSKWSKD